MLKKWLLLNDFFAYYSFFPVGKTYYPMSREAYPTRIDYFVVMRALADFGRLGVPCVMEGPG